MKSCFCAAALQFICVFLLTASAQSSDIVLLNSDGVGCSGVRQINRSLELRGEQEAAEGRVSGGAAESGQWQAGYT